MRDLVARFKSRQIKAGTLIYYHLDGVLLKKWPKEYLNAHRGAFR